MCAYAESTAHVPCNKVPKNGRYTYIIEHKHMMEQQRPRQDACCKIPLSSFSGRMPAVLPSPQVLLNALMPRRAVSCQRLNQQPCLHSCCSSLNPDHLGRPAACKTQEPGLQRGTMVQAHPTNVYTGQPGAPGNHHRHIRHLDGSAELVLPVLLLLLFAERNLRGVPINANVHVFCSLGKGLQHHDAIEVGAAPSGAERSRIRRRLLQTKIASTNYEACSSRTEIHPRWCGGAGGARGRIGGRRRAYIADLAKVSPCSVRLHLRVIPWIRCECSSELWCPVAGVCWECAGTPRFVSMQHQNIFFRL